MRNFAKDFQKTADIISMAFRQLWTSLIFFIGIIANVFSEIHIYFFDVGQGNCILLRNEEHAILIDAGSSSMKFNEAFKAVFEKCLKSAKINGMILTHQEDDHQNFVAGILDSMKSYVEKFQVFSIIHQKTNKEIPNLVAGTNLESLSPIRETYEEGIEYMQSFFNALFSESETSEEKFKFLKANLVSFTKKTDKNATSLVFSFEYRGFKTLFTGDSTGEALDNYIEQGSTSFPGNPHFVYNREIISNTNIFVMPHHGSDTDGSWRWTLNVTKNSPNLVATIINVDAKSSPYRHPGAWIRDVTWPATMQGEEHDITYNRRKDYRENVISENLFTTGAYAEDRFIEIVINAEGIYIKNEKEESYKELLTSSKTTPQKRPRDSTGGSK